MSESPCMTHPPAILVTGSSRGLGRGVAERLAAAGFSVAIHYASNREAADAVAAACKDLAPNSAQIFPVVGGDIGTESGRRGVFDGALGALGRLDALVNNAGIAPRVRADLLDATEGIFDEVLAVNLKGPHFLTQLAARHWLDHPDGSRLEGGYKAIFVTSLSANTASVNRGEYCISKAGLSMSAQLWASRLVEAGIQVMELRPGIMATDMTARVREKYDRLLAEGVVPQKRWGEPADVGRAVESILFNQFPFSTGEIINIDGGFHLRRL